MKINIAKLIKMQKIRGNSFHNNIIFILLEIKKTLQKIVILIKNDKKQKLKVFKFLKQQSMNSFEALKKANNINVLFEYRFL